MRAAQDLADAGDPDYTWQIGTQLTEDDPWAHVGELELVDRFIREVLGWEAYLFNPWEGGDFNESIGGTDGWVDGARPTYGSSGVRRGARTRSTRPSLTRDNPAICVRRRSTTSTTNR